MGPLGLRQKRVLGKKSLDVHVHAGLETFEVFVLVGSLGLGIWAAAVRRGQWALPKPGFHDGPQGFLAPIAQGRVHQPADYSDVVIDIPLVPIDTIKAGGIEHPFVVFARIQWYAG